MNRATCSPTRLWATLRRMVALLGVSVLFVGAPTASVHAEDPKPEKADAAGDTLSTSDAEAADPAAECNREAEGIRKIYRTIPKDFRNPSEPISKITERVVECKARLERFNEGCAAHLKGNEDVYSMLSRMVVALSAHERQAMRDAKIDRTIIRAHMKEYYGHMITLSDKFREIAPKDHPLQAHVWRQTGDGHYYRQNWDQAIACYKKINSDYPKYAELGLVHLGLLRCYVNAQNTRDGIPFARKLIKEHYQRSDLPHYYELLWKLQTIAGNLEGLLALTQEVDRIFPLRSIRKGAKPREKDAYKRYLGYNGFRKGYCHFALGSTGEALDAFVKHVDELDKLREKLERQGQAFPPELDVYRKRSSSNVRFLQNRQGEIPKTGLENIVWAVGEPISFAQAQTKPIAIIFRNVGETRSSHFLKKMDAYAGEHPDLFQLFVLSFTRRTGANANPQEDADEAIQDAAELGLQHTSIGIDPDSRTEEPDVFQACQALIGSATFVVVDRTGRMRWWQQDPRDIDFHFSTAVLGRIALE